VPERAGSGRAHGAGTGPAARPRRGDHSKGLGLLRAWDKVPPCLHAAARHAVAKDKFSRPDISLPAPTIAAVVPKA